MTRIRRLALLVSVPLLLAFAAFVVNQTNQVVLLASGISSTLGQVVLWALLACYLAVILVPIVLFIRLPAPMRPPTAASGPDFDRHLRLLQKRLSQNTRLAHSPIETQEDVEQALGRLKMDADQVIKENASIVFLMTAISQNGRLDGLAVLSAQSRMVWRIAHIYYQRPSLRDMVNLYANVAATAFVAAQLEDIDIEEQIEPIVESVAGAAVGAIPGMTAAATILSTSILTGSTNAFLTLRVGIIAQRYCGSLVIPPKGGLRRLAAAEAARLLIPLVWDGSRRISGSAFRALRKRLGRKIFAREETEVKEPAKAAEDARKQLEKTASAVAPEPPSLSPRAESGEVEELDSGRALRRPWWRVGGNVRDAEAVPRDAKATKTSPADK